MSPLTRHATSIAAAMLLPLSLHAQNFGTQTGNTNTNTNNSVIVSGQNNRILSSPWAFIGSGSGNVITNGGHYSVIGGGLNNFDAGSTNSKLGFIGGGFQNTLGVGARFSVIGGGQNNVISSNSSYGFIGGGALNTVGGAGTSTLYAAVVAGNKNTNLASFSLIFGGGGNKINAGAVGSFIGSGQFNVVAPNAQNAAVLSGYSNVADANYALVMGGYFNEARGVGSSVIGGERNLAGASNSMAAGTRAKATNTGAFVWADASTNADFASTTNNQFLIRASGGVGINTNNPGTNSLFVRGRTQIDGDLEVTGNILGNLSISNATFSSLTVNTLTSSNGAITLQPGGTTGFSVSVLTNDGTKGSSRNVLGGHPSNSVAAGRVGATIGGGGGVIGGELFSNTVTWNFGTVGGGLGNTADGYATVAGGDLNKATGLWSTIAGGSDNVASGEFSAIGGGENNRAAGGRSIVGGGAQNSANGDHATVPGGLNNAATNNAFAAGTRAKATNQGAFVWADSQNADFASTTNDQFLIRASGGVGINTNNPGTNALLVGGTARITGNLQVDGNIAGNIAISNAEVDSVSSPEDFVLNAGGTVGLVVQAEKTDQEADGNGFTRGRNLLAGYPSNGVGPNTIGATIAGGGGIASIGIVATNGATNWTTNNRPNQVTGDFGTVGGGLGNTTEAFAGTVAGGENNKAGGEHATVPGGLNNEASGTGSFAAGVNAKATHDYSFVWGGDPTVDTESFGEGTYTASAPRGVRFITSASGTPDSGAEIQAGQSNWTNYPAPPIGASLEPNSTSWASLSDSNAKTAVTPIDHRETLRKVAALPVTAWNYTHDPNRRYIGPMAQDFHAAFGLGADDKHISTLDTDGVTLSAIKGLVEEIQEQDAALSARDRQIEALERAVETMRESIEGGSF
jgi:hypothetical protein